MRADLPTGTVTFLFTDVEGSTKLLHELGAEGYAHALAEHRRTIREACARHAGVEVDTQGDAFFFAFPTAPGALAAAREATEALASGPIQVRLGLHTGTPLLAEEGYVGGDVHRVARIAAAGSGGQILVSTSTAALMEPSGSKPQGAVLVDLGEHRFKDLAAPERVYQLGDGDFPALKSLYRTNLPIPATPFLGRERELAHVVGLLSQEDVRQLTLTGPGGTGKTRLALQAAAESFERFPDGIWWVPLASIRDASAVPSQIAQTVGATADLTAHIADKRMLLLLDNFEHLLDAAPEIAALLATCPNLAVLATSRELLQLRGEVVYAVPTLTDDDGTKLFLARALAVAGDVSGDGTVGEICRRLDNLPLALELAAARTRHLTPDQLLERLAQRLDLLTAGRDADPRQQTLRATIEWSYELLEEDERRLFARLSVFAGGYTLESAEAVCGADLDTLSSLVDKSLVRKAGDRFWMLETIREFAAERLEDYDEVDALRRRHAEYFLELARTLGFTVESVEAGAIQRHDVAIAEHGNIRTAIDWASDSEPDLALGIALALENFWVSYNPFEAVRVIGELAERVDATPGLRAHVLRCLGNLVVMTGEVEAGVELYEQSMELCRETGDERGVAILQLRIANNVFDLGERARARKLLEESLVRSRAIGFRTNEMMARGSLGSFDYREGNVERGLEAMEEAAALARESGFKWWETNLLSALADYALADDRLVQAERYGRTALVLAGEMGDRRHAVQALGLLAALAVGRGDTERAGRLWGAIEGEELRGPLGLRPRMATWDEERARFESIVLAHRTPELERALEAGRRMTLEDAYEYALGDADA
jgi:predicted ATPase/class 3 adenylate cyclase